MSSCEWQCGVHTRDAAAAGGGGSRAQQPLRVLILACRCCALVAQGGHGCGQISGLIFEPGGSSLSCPLPLSSCLLSSSLSLSLYSSRVSTQIKNQLTCFGFCLSFYPPVFSSFLRAANHCAPLQGPQLFLSPDHPEQSRKLPFPDSLCITRQENRDLFPLGNLQADLSHLYSSRRAPTPRRRSSPFT